MASLSTPVLILGTGIAGLSSALKFAERGQSVLLISKTDLMEGNTRYAQGGIASVWSAQDSFAEHESDTLNAGAGLCHEKTVRICVQEGPTRVRELIALGVEFTRDHKDYDLHREGGHGKHRILHADDLTGLAIETALVARVRENPLIQTLQNHIAIDLITEGKLFKRWRRPGRCLGAYVLNSSTGEVLTISAAITVLATGGAGKVYQFTSNPDVATGDGIAMAHRAGAHVANLEFMQFHPTCLYSPLHRTFLITEALRGDGAVLRNLRGEEFMPKYHPMGSLAPRDIVARSIDQELKHHGSKHVWLDCTAIGAADLRTRFPNISKLCDGMGIDITTQPIPVVPAAHYMCGGVLVDENAATSIAGLYAVGETACTGLHGANRLASNSLLEAIVFADRAVAHACSALTWLTQPRAADASANPALPRWEFGKAVKIDDQIDIAANWFEVRHLMWNYVGIVRSNARLERASQRLELIRKEVHEFYWNYLPTHDLIELRNIVSVAELIVQSAKLRKESRGLHYTVDFPERNDSLFRHDTVL